MERSELDDFVDEYHRALDEFFRGDPEPAKRLYSHREDASLAAGSTAGDGHVTRGLVRPNTDTVRPPLAFAGSATGGRGT